MFIIKKLSEQICEELDGMEEYAKDAIEYKESDPDLSKMYYEMAKTEHEHMQKLHDQVVRKIREAETSGVEIPQIMRILWKEKHEEIIEKAAKAKMYLDMY